MKRIAKKEEKQHMNANKMHNEITKIDLGKNQLKKARVKTSAEIRAA